MSRGLEVAQQIAQWVFSLPRDVQRTLLKTSNGLFVRIVMATITMTRVSELVEHGLMTEEEWGNIHDDVLMGYPAQVVSVFRKQEYNQENIWYSRIPGSADRAFRRWVGKLRHVLLDVLRGQREGAALSRQAGPQGHRHAAAQSVAAAA